MNKRKENVSSFHGIGGLKSRDGLFLGVNLLFLVVLVGSYHP